jgi:hypothetical protein
MTQAIRDRIQRWVSLPHPPEKIWAEIGGFGDMAAWHPGIESAEVFDIEGEIHRHLTLGDGGLILERLVETGPPRHAELRGRGGRLPCFLVGDVRADRPIGRRDRLRVLRGGVAGAEGTLRRVTPRVGRIPQPPVQISGAQNTSR